MCVKELARNLMLLTGISCFLTGATFGQAEKESKKLLQKAEEPAQSEKSDDLKNNRLVLKDVFVTATRTRKDPLQVPYATYSIDPYRIFEYSPKTLPESLKSYPGIMLQKTGNGFTSPYLRGWTSQRTVLMTEGVRLNNSFWREGPNEYWNQTNHLFYDNVEIVLGAASVMYGSDAVGGAVNISTDFLRGEEGAGWQSLDGSILYRYSSAEQSKGSMLTTTN